MAKLAVGRLEAKPQLTNKGGWYVWAGGFPNLPGGAGTGTHMDQDTARHLALESLKKLLEEEKLVLAKRLHKVQAALDKLDKKLAPSTNK